MKPLVVEISGYDVQRAYAVLLDEELRARPHVCPIPEQAEEPPLGLSSNDISALEVKSCDAGHRIHRDGLVWLEALGFLDRRAVREMMGKEK